MVLTKEELIGSLRNEVRILLHLAGKVDESQLDYRPTPKQRSTLELLQYMVIMAPTDMAVIKGGVFDRTALGAAWRPAEAYAKTLDLGQAMEALRKQADECAAELEKWTEADFRFVIDVFGRKSTRGSLMVSLVLGGYAAYRTQLFCYLKACGQDNLNTMNLWGGADGPA